MFTYDPLHGPSSMRFVELLPDRINNQIQANLINHNGQQAKYRCLSYMWGPPTEDYKILLNGQAFSVRQNLYTFLNMATGYFPNEPLWIDAICINQTDLVEKSHQVQRMGEIYRDAEEVLVWLGFDHCFDILFCPWKGDLKKQLSGVDTDTLRSCVLHPYFSRAWITQEILLGRKIRVLHKNMQLRWATFGARTQVVSLELGRRRVRVDDEVLLELYDLRKTANWKKGPGSLMWPIIAYCLSRFSFTSERMQTSAGSPLGKGYYDFFDVLNRRSQSQCMDDRDRIFSLNSLLEPGHGFQVDYHDSRQDVFWKVCQHFNAWVDLTRIRQIADALSLSTLDLLISMEGRLTESITLRFQEGRFHEPSPSRYGGSSDQGQRPLYCKKNRSGDPKHAARVERRTKDDMLLCPIQYGISETPEYMRPHLVISQGQPGNVDSMTITLFHGLHTQVVEGMSFSHYSHGHVITVKDWSQIEELKKVSNSKAVSNTWWELKVPLFYATDAVAWSRDESVPDLASTLKSDQGNLIASRALKEAFLHYTGNE
jgi:hypothetical protein